jgi:hypothetical protein
VKARGFSDCQKQAGTVPHHPKPQNERQAGFVQENSLIPFDKKNDKGFDCFIFFK